MSDNLKTLKSCIAEEAPSSLCIKKIKNFSISELAPNNRPIRDLILVKSVDGAYKKENMAGIIVSYNGNETNSKIKVYLNKGFSGTGRRPIRITKMQKLATKQNVQWKILDQTWKIVGNDESSEFQIVKKEENDQGDQKLNAALQFSESEEKIDVQFVQEESFADGASLVEEEVEIEISNLFNLETIEEFKNAIRKTEINKNIQSESVDIVITNFFKENEDYGESEEDDGESEEDDGESEEDDGESEEDDGESEEDDGESKEDDGESKEDDGESKEDDGESKEDDDKKLLKTVDIEAKEEQLILKMSPKEPPNQEVLVETKEEVTFKEPG